MLKFIKHHMEGIVGVEIFPIISFFIFFTFFVVLTIYVLSYDKKKVEKLSNLPFESSENQP
jgi:hypothetical protein